MTSGSDTNECRLGTVISPPPVVLPSLPRDVPETALDRRGSHGDMPWFGGKVRLGICCMAKKMESKQMGEFLRRLEAMGQFDIVRFDQDMILHSPPSEWLKVDCCIPFFSAGFPLDRAIEYAHMHPDCFCLTEPAEQQVLLDRRAVYHALERNNIPTSRHIFCSRDGWRGAPEPVIEEEEDSITINGDRMDKPFVEKPVDSEDHRIRIYYPGGGARQLFRKVGDRSSEYLPDVSRIRREGSYIYEEFVDTEHAQDVKVYTVGTDYFHAECRKSPVVDGQVTRDAMGKEVRQQTVLSEQEQQIARKIVKVFRQRVCGFDLLRGSSAGGGYSPVGCTQPSTPRAQQGSFVCDVNGWSFVKGNQHYYDRASHIIAGIFVEEMRKRGLARIFRDPRQCGQRTLKGVIALFRHGDRTPKQKIKLKTSHSPILRKAFSEGDPIQEIVLKGDSEKRRDELLSWRELMLQQAAVLEADEEASVKLRGMAAIIGREAEGLKLQIKPQKTDKATGQVKSIQVILKWGGWLTEAGRKQSRHLGDNFNRRVFRGNEFVDHMAVFANNERRVKLTAREFASALRRDEEWGEENINPGDRGGRICKALDDTEPAKDHIERCKEFVKLVMHADSEEECLQWVHLPGFKEIMNLKQTPRRAMRHLWRLVNDLVRHIPEDKRMHRGESSELMQQRWSAMADAFYDPKKDVFDTTKISDISDYITYDVSYNQKALAPLDMYPLFELAHAMHSFVVVAEYGLDRENRALIGSLLAAPLLREWMQDLEELQFEDAPQTRLYFSSESHVQALYNLLYNCSSHLTQPLHVVSDPIPLHYLAHIVIKAYKYDDMREGSLGRYQYEVFFSGGIDTNAFGIVQDHHVTQLSPMIRIHNNLFYSEFRKIVDRANEIAACPTPAEQMKLPAPYGRAQ